MSPLAYRKLQGRHTLLRIFLGESDKAGHKPLYMEILRRARGLGLAGCTVLRGIAGFGATSVVHRNFPPDFSLDMPIVVEVVDTPANTRRLLKEIAPLLQGILVTEEKVGVLRYGHGRPSRKKA